MMKSGGKKGFRGTLCTLTEEISANGKGREVRMRHRIFVTKQ
jgi:hypothetical protein